MVKLFKYPLISFCLFLALIPCKSWAGSADSLLALIKTTKSETVKVDALIEMAALSKEPGLLNYLNEAFSLAQKIEYKNGVAAAHMALGKYHYHKENFSVSLLHCISAYHIAKEMKNYKVMAVACLYIGYNNYLSQPEISLKYYFKCIEYCKLSGYKWLEAYGYSAIGNIYESRIEGKSALYYYNMSLKLRKEVGSPSEIVSSLIETARAFNRLQDYQKSTELVQEALGIAEANKGNEQNLVYLYEMNGHDIAGRYKDYKTALTYFLKAYSIAQQNNLDYTDCTKPIAEMYYKLEDFKNSAYYFKIYNDLIFQNKEKRQREILKTEVVLKAELEKEKIATLSAESEVSKMTVQKQHLHRKIYIASIIVLISFLFFIYRNSRLKGKLNQNLEQQVKERTSDLESVANKLMSSEKRLKEINIELESFIYRTSHDLKGPLASSKGLVNLALESEDPNEVWEYLRLMSSSLDKLDWILVTLYEVSVIRKGHVLLKNCDISGLINNLLNTMSDRVNYERMKFTIHNQIKGNFVTDEILTQTILRNILENTVKYSQLGILHPYVNIIITEDNQYNIITVEDNGIGIKPEFKDKIFDPFFRANDTTKGSGLGLYIVKNAIDKMGGKIELVKSEPHVGTVFRMYFLKQKPT